MKRILTTIITVTMTMAALVTLTSCEEEDDYIAQQLRQGDWQGYIGAYYSTVGALAAAPMPPSCASSREVPITPAAEAMS